MATYREMIVEDTGCTPDDAAMIEHIMREDIFHSTLDWQTRARFRRGAREAATLLQENRDLYEFEQAETQRIIEEMRGGTPNMDSRR